jgi:hypothetical protein
LHSPLIIYQQRIEEFTTEINGLRKQLAWIPWLRLGSFILTGVAIYLVVRYPGVLFVLAAIIAFTGFLAAGWYDSRLKRRIDSLQQLIRINLQEINAIDGDYSVFHPGNEFVDQDHPYTHDLDIFGAGSLFQYVNRTATVFGKERLARYLSHAIEYKDSITERQQAIEEFAAMLEFRQDLQQIFIDTQTSSSDLSS